MRRRGQRVAWVRAQGMRIGLHGIDEQATRRLLRAERELIARARFPEPVTAREVLERARAHACEKRWDAQAAAAELGTAAPASLARGAAALALAAGAALAIVLCRAGTGAPVVAAAGAGLAAWLMFGLPSIARVADVSWYRLLAGLWRQRALGLERRLLARDAVLRRRREQAEAETALDLAALAAGVAEGMAAARNEEALAHPAVQSRQRGAILDVVQ